MQNILTLIKTVTVVMFLIGGNLSAQNADIRLLRDINLNRNTHLDKGFELLSTSIYPVSAILPTSAIIIGYVKKDSAYLNKGIYIGASILSNFAITYALKYSINRERPYKTYPFIDNAVSEKSPSFPSGHSSDAFATATAFSLAFPKWYVIAPSFLWASGVAYSRMHLGVHYPSDIIVGCIVGSGTAYACHKLNMWLHRK
jgi:membrane-associated phospholipid phosphatase